MIDPLSKWLQHNAGNHGPVMLMYHAISPGGGTPTWPWAVSRQRFRSQLDALRDYGWHTVTMDRLLAHSEPIPDRTVVLTFDDGYVDNLDAVVDLRERGQCASWFIATSAIGREPTWADSGRPQGRMLSASELREMRAAGMEIGSHTVSHARLTDVDDPSLERELTMSRRTLEDVLGARVPSFAYPYGAFDERCVRAVAKAGYSSACTTRTGWALRDGDPFRMRRLTVFNHDSAASMLRKLALGTHDVAVRQLLPRAFGALGNRLSKKLLK